MAREVCLLRPRGGLSDVRQATGLTNTNRVNKANQFTPRPVQLSNIRPNLSTASNTIKTGRVNVNTGYGNVSTVSSAGTHIKSGSFRFNTGKQNINSGSVHVNTARVNRPVSNQTSNNTSPKLFQEYSPQVKINMLLRAKMGTTVKTSAGPILKIIKNYPKWDLLLLEEVKTEEAADLMVVSSTSLTGATRKAAVSEKIAKKKTHSPKQPSSTPISKSADDIMTFRKDDNLNNWFEEVLSLAILKHLLVLIMKKRSS
ncbi:hypothetical protein Tco_1217864 [Tanacetum coccineum]